MNRLQHSPHRPWQWGNRKARLGSTGAGGALRNENEDWEDGFTARLGSSKIEEAES